MVYGQYEAALLFSDRHKAGARKMENRWSLIAKPTLKTMISKLLTDNEIIIDEISVQGEDLETYFENLIGGRKNV